MITLVTGMGRCGSSLTMQMLKAAGLDVVGEAPGYEAQESEISKFYPEWLLEQEGKCVKLLAMQKMHIHPGDYRVIFLKRNPREQARSQSKFHKIMIGDHRAELKAMEKRVKLQSKACYRKACTLGPALSLRFEDFFDRPVFVISRLIEFLGLEDRVEEVAPKMYGAIISRPTKCMDSMQIEAMLSDKNRYAG